MGEGKPRNCTVGAAKFPGYHFRPWVETLCRRIRYPLSMCSKSSSWDTAEKSTRSRAIDAHTDRCATVQAKHPQSRAKELSKHASYVVNCSVAKVKICIQASPVEPTQVGFGRRVRSIRTLSINCFFAEILRNMTSLSVTWPRRASITFFHATVAFCWRVSRGRGCYRLSYVVTSPDSMSSFDGRKELRYIIMTSTFSWVPEGVLR